MIVDSKQGLPDDCLPLDAPPSYDMLQVASASTSYPLDEKISNPTTPLPSTSPSSSSNPSAFSPGSIKRTSAKGKGTSYWFNFGASRTTKENVNSTVLNLVRDLVKQQPSAPGASGILDSCSEACHAYDISFSSLLQKKSIENHTPLYWAIIKRPSEPPNPDDYDLVTALLSRSAPLKPSTISEIRLACLLTSDQALFQRLRLSPAFSPLSGTDEIILGASIPPDTIEVADIEGDEGAFVANFEILAFQKRMRVSHNIELEFIARGRMWCLAFTLDESSKWVVKLSILEHSPATWLDSRLIIEAAARRSTTAAPPAPSLIDFESPDEQPVRPSKRKRGKPIPSINIRMQTKLTQLAPPSSNNVPNSSIVVALEDSVMGPSLQYDSYLDAEGTLRARLEARLAKPGAECIIC